MNKSGIDVIDRLHFFIEESGVADLISGGVYKGSYSPDPSNVDDEFIVINTLQLKDYDVVREIPGNINLYVSDKKGQQDLSRFRYLTPQIEELLKPYESLKSALSVKARDKTGTYSDVETDLTKEYFKFKVIMSHGPYNDEREKEVFKGHSKFNFRVNCWIEK